MRSVGFAVGFAFGCAALGACADYGTSSPYPPSPPGPPAPRLVQVEYCSSLAPQWVAFQDGDGAWTRAAPTATGANTVFQHSFETNRGGIATLSPGGLGITVLSVRYGKPEELATAGNTRPLLCGNPDSKTLLGTIAGLGANETAAVSGGLLSRSVVTPAAGGQFSLKALPGGPRDLIATRTAGANGPVTGIILRRNVNLPDSTTLPVFDFSSAEAFAPATATLTVPGLGPEGASVSLRLITETAEVFLSPPSASLLAARPYAAVPAAKLQPTDLQVLFASTASGGDIRSAQVFFRSPADRTLALPALIARPVFATVEAAPSLRLRAQFAPQADYDRETSIIYQEGATTNVSVSMTAAYAALVGGYDLVVPDLSGVPGFDPAWALHPGDMLRWTASRIGGTLGLGQGAVPTDGATQRSGFATDIIPGS